MNRSYKVTKYVAPLAALLWAGAAQAQSCTATCPGDVFNTGRYVDTGTVTGTFVNLDGGVLIGTGSVGALTLEPGSIVAPGGATGGPPATLGVTGNLTMVPGATYQVRLVGDSADAIAVGGSANLFGGRLTVLSPAGLPTLGSAYTVLTAQGGVYGAFSDVLTPATITAAGLRFDTLYDARAVEVVVTPGAYAGLAAAGIAESGVETDVGRALDAVRPVAGARLSPAQAALFNPLYAQSAGGITAALDQLAPSIYADALMTGRAAWAMVGAAVSDQLAARRGMSDGAGARAAAGPGGSTIWVSALGGFGSTAANGGAPGFSGSTGGGVVGIDAPVSPALRLGVMAGGASLDTNADNDAGHADATDALLIGYGAYRQGVLFAEAQFGGVYQQQSVTRDLPAYGVSARGDTDGFGYGGGVRAGAQLGWAGWLVEPSLGLSAMSLRQGDVTETGAGLLAETIGGQSVDSVQSTVAVDARHALMLGRTRLEASARLGWSHEYADSNAHASADVAALSGSGFSVGSAPTGRDAALVGLGVDVEPASWPVSLFAGYGGAYAANSNAQSFDVGVGVSW